MKKEIEICEKKIGYILRRSNRARRMRLTVCPVIKNTKIINSRMKNNKREDDKCERQSEVFYNGMYCDGNLTVTAPAGMEQFLIERFILEKSQWIVAKIKYFKRFPVKFYVKTKKSDFLKYKIQALSLVQKRIENFNKIYGFRYNRVNIKNQKTRWGSCSRAGNLNFNYKIALLPQNLADYIIVHELCHLGEFNHSKKFWQLLVRAIPEYTRLRQELKNGLLLK